jgi:hypothetical protein
VVEVVVGPASPEWLIDEYEEMVEFVASIPPLLTLWEQQALALANELDNASLVDDPIEELHHKEMNLRDLERNIRSQLAFLRSPALCRTRAQRQFLDELWARAGLPALEDELERRLTLLAERQEQVVAMVSSIDEHNRRKQQERADRLGLPVQVVLGFLAAASLAEVLGWINQAFGVEGRGWAWIEAFTLMVSALVVVLVIVRARRPR